MKTKQPKVPSEIQAFIDDGRTTFHCDDGDWDLRIESREDSDFKDELPPRSIMIAENGSGDCLFLKTSAAGKIDSKVFVYWHEENRSEAFAKSLKELIATSAKNEKQAAKQSKTPPAARSSLPLDKVEKAIFATDVGKQMQARADFQSSQFGLEALPMLRRALASDNVSTVIFAAECIAKFGPEAAACPAGEATEKIAVEHVDRGSLIDQLRHRGAQMWSYSGVANCYPGCLDALVKLGFEPEYLIEYVQMHIGHGYAILHSLKALQSIGTSEARDLAERAVDFWLPEMNMSEAKKAKAILESFDGKKKKK